MVIINIREQKKLETRKKIVDNSTQLLEEYGIINTSTKMISEKCSISHGTLFLHFKTKELLFIELLVSNIDKLNIEVQSRCSGDLKARTFMNRLLSSLTPYENILSRVYKDEAFLPGSVSRSLESFENTLKNLLLDNYRLHSSKRVQIVEAFILIDAFISQLKNYLIQKEYSIHAVSVLKQKKGRIIKLFDILFGVEY